MNILGIETSCDETAAAVVSDGTKALSSVVASSAEMHAKTGGIIPEKAAREQIKSVIPVVNEALKEASLTKDDISAIAVTVGPGLVGSLLVGVETAKTLSHLWQKPIIPVNHLVGHIYANFLDGNTPTFPALTLLVSGGHTDLVLFKDQKQMSWIGGTRDDAAGEAFDKCARLLGLGYPGGPEIAKAAERFSLSKKQSTFSFPRPLADDSSFDWSFSGLKTAVLREVENLKKNNQLNGNKTDELAFQVQEAIVDVLVLKTLKAVITYQPKSLLLAGGVAANSRLRDKFASEIASQSLKVDLLVPLPKLCTDNAAYIAACAFFNYQEVSWQEVSVNPELTITGQT